MAIKIILTLKSVKNDNPSGAGKPKNGNKPKAIKIAPPIFFAMLTI